MDNNQKEYQLNDELDYEKLDNNASALSGISYVPIPAPKKQLGLKITATVLYAIITAIAFPVDIAFLIDAIINLTRETEGWEGLGVGIGIALILVFSLIVTISAVVLYQIPGILCIAGFCLSFTKTKLKAKRQGKIWFPVLGLAIIVSEIILIAIMVAIILLVNFAN